MTSSKFLVDKDSIYLSCIRRFVNLNCLIVVLLTMRGKCFVSNKQMRFKNLWKLLKEKWSLTRNFQLVIQLTAAKQPIRKWQRIQNVQLLKLEKKIKCVGLALTFSFHEFRLSSTETHPWSPKAWIQNLPIQSEDTVWII